MNNIPQLPQDISSDGREVWDWADKMAQVVAKNQKIRDLRAKLAKNAKECGDCDKWMKSRFCPREKNVNGRNVGPSMSSPICNEFIQNETSIEFGKEWQAELDSVINGTNSKTISR
jgi:hypothetical protein